jgi:hypothetical protein
MHVNIIVDGKDAVVHGTVEELRSLLNLQQSKVQLPLPRENMSPEHDEFMNAKALGIALCDELLAWCCAFANNNSGRIPLRPAMGAIIRTGPDWGKWSPMIAERVFETLVADGHLQLVDSFSETYQVT